MYRAVYDGDIACPIEERGEQSPHRRTCHSEQYKTIFSYFSRVVAGGKNVSLFAFRVSSATVTDHEPVKRGVGGTNGMGGIKTNSAYRRQTDNNMSVSVWIE